MVGVARGYGTTGVDGAAKLLYTETMRLLDIGESPAVRVSNGAAQGARPARGNGSRD
jgi:hypothetical protein